MRLNDPFDYYARILPDLVFAQMGDREVTYGEAHGITNQIGNALLAEGLSKGDRVGILSKNSIEYSLFYLGAAKAGVVPVPLNYRLAPAEWSYILNDSGAKLLLSQNEFASGIDSVRSELGKIGTFFSIDGGGGGGWDDFAVWVGPQRTSRPGCEVSDGDDLYQMYTSGTTGLPKGAVLTHGAVMSNVWQFQVAGPGSLGEKALIVAPLYHAAAGIVSFATTASGGTLVIQPEFNPIEVVRSMSEEGISRSLLVPAMIQACLVMVPDVAERKYKNLRCVIYGASPIAVETLRRAIEVFGCEFMQGYGMTETTAALTFLTPEDHKRALGGDQKLLLSAGRALPGTEIRIVDEDGKPVPNGTIGEITGKGPQLMKGYWNLPEASARALHDGWMHTGDAGVLDDEGYLYIQDRLKDMIVSGGENVYPREVEEVLYRHPAIAESAVIGVPDEKWGEAVKAVVVLKQGESATAEQIVDFCKEKLGGYKRPRSVDFIEALPRNSSGKVLKKDLRAPYWKGQTRRVS